MKNPHDAPRSADASSPDRQVLNGADRIVRVLAQEGVDIVFGYTGGNILPTIDALCRHNAAQEAIEFIVPANEQGAGFMASGYARSSGRVGVVLVTSGPGATNTVTPIRDALADSIPMVCITGQVPRADIGTDAFQEAPVFHIMSACAKQAFLVMNPEELEATVRAAFEIARSGRPGPVVVDIPKDVQLWKGGPGIEALPLPGYRGRLKGGEGATLSPTKGEAFFKNLADSRRPLLYAGGGVIHGEAAEELKAFAETFRIPVTTTLMGLGAFDSGHPLSLHMLGMHGTPYANYAVEDCDFLFAVGARFDDRVAGKVKEFAPNAKFIAHLDIDASEIGKMKSVHWSHVAGAKAGLKDLLEAGKALGFRRDFSPWLAHVGELKTNHPLNYRRDGDLIQPQRVLELLSRIVDGEAIIATGVGQHQMWAAQYLRHKAPRRFLTSGSMGTMGYGLPAAIGAQFAHPERLVIDIDGDGSLRMNLGDLETVATYNLPVKVLLLNNEGDGMVRQVQSLYYGSRHFGIDKSRHTMDFTKAAEAAGYPFARKIARPEETEEALRAFLSSTGPAFLEVRIDPFAAVYPMVGPGEGYKEMMTGPWIPSRNGH
ncbi:MAG: biosynthetic-type acetolactate synthase large subunit [Elusimicrobia bacterium]|nr:biosynthetic-type acetolactate synthase large subunit [Elusimicrobiota bacterium]